MFTVIDNEVNVGYVFASGLSSNNNQLSYTPTFVFHHNWGQVYCRLLLHFFHLSSTWRKEGTENTLMTESYALATSPLLRMRVSKMSEAEDNLQARVPGVSLPPADSKPSQVQKHRAAAVAPTYPWAPSP